MITPPRLLKRQQIPLLLCHTGISTITIPSPLAYIYIYIYRSQYGMGIKGLAKLLSDEAPDVRCCTVIRNVFSVLTVVSSNRCLNHLY